MFASAEAPEVLSVESPVLRAQTVYDLELRDVGPSQTTIESQFDATSIPVSKNGSTATTSSDGTTSARSSDFGWSIYLGIQLFFVFTGYNAAQSVLVVLLPSYASIVLSLIYYLFGTAGLFAQFPAAKIGPKWCICIGCTMSMLWIGSLLINIAGLVIAASVVAGICFGLLWPSEGIYISRTRGGPRAHNAFWLIFFFCWITAGVVGGILLTYLSSTIFLAVMMGINGVGWIMSLFAKNLKQIEGEKTADITLKGLFRTFLLFKDPKLLLVLPTVLARASALAFFIAKLPVLLPSLQVVPFAVVVYAITLILIQVLLLFVWSYPPAWLWSWCQTFFLVCAMVLSICSPLVATDGRLYLLYVVAGCLGAGECFGMGILNSFVASVFSEDPASVFSIVRGLEAYTVGTVILICNYAPLVAPVVIVLVTAVLAGVGITVLFVYTKYLENKKKGLRFPNPVFRSTRFNLQTTVPAKSADGNDTFASVDSEIGKTI